MISVYDRLLLDSDSLIVLLKQNPELQAKIGQADPHSIALSVISVAEILTNNLKHFNRLSIFGLQLENWKS